MIEPFLVRAALAGVGVAIAAAPIGCFVVWRRMAYFGDAVAHAAILGVALSLAVSISITFGALLAAVAMALTVAGLGGRALSVDTLLGVMAHSALAIGLVLIALLDGVRVNIEVYLFGDILAVGAVDIWVIWGGATLVLAGLWWRWQPLLAATLDPDMAAATGIRADRETLWLTIALAITVAVAIKIVGVLLIASLMIIPAAAARPFARTPEAMAAAATLVAVAATLGGLWASFAWDTPTGPTIVAVAAAVFAAAMSVRGLRP